MQSYSSYLPGFAVSHRRHRPKFLTLHGWMTLATISVAAGVVIGFAL